MRTRLGVRAILCAWLIVNLCAAEVLIPSGTKISCRLEQSISSATADEGQPVQLSVTENVKVGDVIVIPQGAVVEGRVVEATAKRRMGRTGKLDFSIDKVRAADGEFIPLRYTMQKKEGGSHAVSTGVMTAGAAVLFWPAAPFFLLRKGKDVTINKGIVLEVFTDQDHVFKPATAEAQPSGNTSVAQANGMATVTITSNMPGAEIEIDGAFVGSTPTTRQVAPGSHKIVVKSSGDTWERTMDVQAGGSTNVNATLKR
jgi:PEGA domain